MSKTDEKEVLVSINNLKKHFNVGSGKALKAVDGITLDIIKGETIGLVGESGCGKTTAGRTIMGLYEATNGEVLYEGVEIHKLSKKEKRELKKKMQIILQDPYASLNPRMTVGDIIAEGIDIHELYKGEKRLERIYELLTLVGLNKEHASRFPHEFSGGQRQRIGIARALAIDPEFIVCDEPISALDVSIQAQVVNLLIDLQKKFGLTYLFIAHDLSMVKHISDRVGVMYLGKLVELTTSKSLYSNPNHPYTQALLSAIPEPDPRANIEEIELTGEVPSPLNPPKGCRFSTRCSYVMDICTKEEPKLVDIGEGHLSACHLNSKSK